MASVKEESLITQGKKNESSDEYESAEENDSGESRSLLDTSPSEISVSSYASAQKEKCRNLVAYWFLGLTNNFAYVIMLSAAHDILSEDFNKIGITDIENVTTGVASNVTQSFSNTSTNPRDCNMLSTGTILLADIIPSLAIKMMAPFIPVMIHLRIGTVVTLCTISFLLVSLAVSSSMAILGVVFASASAGLGETTFLAYSTFYHQDVISTWSSGTGGAGLFGALSYAALTSLGLSSRQAILLMLIVPVMMAVSFWKVLEHPPSTRLCLALPHSEEGPYHQIEGTPTGLPAPPPELQRLSFDEKLRVIPSLMRFMVPLSLVYVAEYLINQGLSELIYFPASSAWISHDQQYRWYQVLYQIGVLVSRSSVNLVYIRRIWITALLQWINVVVFLTGAIYWWFGSIWLAFALILWEGLLGGAAYVNTFYRLSKEVTSEEKEFAIQMTSLSDSLGITFAGFLAIPIHNLVCSMPIL